MGWQKRGRGHNSATGQGAAMGLATGKVVTYSTKCKMCRVCSYNKWTGKEKKAWLSKKTQWISKINGKGCCLWTVEKSSSIWSQIFNLCRGWWLNNPCRHKEQSPLWCWEMVRCWSCQEIPQYQTIQSWRLLQRIELLNSQFKDYKLHHWVLQFLCQPNVGDPESLKQDLKKIIPYAFGEHTCCNVS